MWLKLRLSISMGPNTASTGCGVLQLHVLFISGRKPEWMFLLGYHLNPFFLVKTNIIHKPQMN